MSEQSTRTGASISTTSTYENKRIEKYKHEYKYMDKHKNKNIHKYKVKCFTNFNQYH